MSDQLDFLAISGPTSSPKRKISRDEMNLAEFPLSVLSTRVSPGKKTLEFEDSIYDKNGRQVSRQWIITAADKFGLPTSSDDEVLLGLLKLSVDCGLEKRKIFFTRYELLRTLKWSTEGRSYSRLSNALDRLSGVRIKATNSFYDNEAKSYSTRNFGIIDAYELNSGRAQNAKPSYFIWSEALFKSFRSGFIKKLDFDFFLELDSAVTKRLYRFLDKHFWYRSKFKMNLFTLAHEKIGVSRTYRYPSSIRQQIDPAAEELIAKGFLADVLYSGKGKHTEVTFVAAGDNGSRSSGPKNVATNLSENNLSENPSSVSAGGGSLGEDNSQATKDHASRDFNNALNRSHSHTKNHLTPEHLMDRGIRRPQAMSLVKKLVGEKDHERALSVVAHFDQLVANKSDLISRNAPGFLYRAIQAPWDFSLPEDMQTLKVGRALKAGRMLKSDASSKGSRKSQERAQQNSNNGLELQYLTERKRDLQKMRTTVEPELLSKLEREVTDALGNIKGLISEQSFKEAVSHGLEERLAKLLVYPDFDEWKKSKR